MHSVVNKFIFALEANLAEKKVQLKLTKAAHDWLAVKGYDPLMGARPMARLIQNEIKKPLANKLLFSDLQDGGRVVIDVVNDKIELQLEQEEVVS
jgi:ATP-dependent Clp protease ATP-binding subunit ClpA